MSEMVVLSGWGIKPDLLKPVFGNSACYCDLNKLMPLLFEENRLRNDWIGIAASRINDITPDGKITITGWSTGAIIAWAVAPLLSPDKICLLSAAPSFCRTPQFKHGMRVSVIDGMIDALQTDPQKTLLRFHKRCGIQPDSSVLSHYSSDELLCGLRFLREVNLYPVRPLTTITPPLFLHGKDDLIISPQAAALFSKEAHGIFYELPGPHAFFTQNSTETTDLLGQNGFYYNT